MTSNDPKHLVIARPKFGDHILPERFWDKVSVEPNTGCWLWAGSCDTRGYGQLYWKGKSKRTHRLVLGLACKTVLVVDHLCRQHSCCNPDHLDVVTQAVNTLRGDTVNARNIQKTHCWRGHALSGSNVLTYGPSRHCKQCAKIRSQQFRERKLHEG